MAGVVIYCRRLNGGTLFVDSFFSDPAENEVATVLIRHLEKEVVRRLEQRASVNKRSLDSELRQILEQAARGDIAVKKRGSRQLSRKMWEKTSGRIYTPSHLLVREDRDRDHEAY